MEENKSLPLHEETSKRKDKMKKIFITYLMLLAIAISAHAQQYRGRVTDRLWQLVPQKGTVMAVDEFIHVWRGHTFVKAVTNKKTKKVELSFRQKCYFVKEMPDSFDTRRFNDKHNDGRYLVCQTPTKSGMMCYEIVSLTDSTMTLRQSDGMELDYKMTVSSQAMESEYARTQRAGMVDAVKFIYQYILPFYYNDMVWDQDLWLEKFCTPSLQHQQNLISKWEEKNSEVVIGYDYWISAQDYIHPTMKVVGSKAKTDSTGVVRICITEDSTFTPSMWFMRLEMKKVDGAWLIDDFKSEDKGKICSLRRISRNFLKEQYAEALEKEKKEYPVKRQAEVIDSSGKPVKILMEYKKGDKKPSRVKVMK